MTAAAIQEIERRARDGDADAQYALAGILVERRQGNLARYWIEQAAARGHADALFTLAAAVLTASEGAIERRAEAVGGLMEAREKGSIAALRVLAALTAAGFVGEGGWNAAVTMLKEGCEARDAAALREAAALLFQGDEDDPDGAAMLSAAAAREKFAAALVDRRRMRNRATSSGGYSVEDAFAKIAALPLKGAPQKISERPNVTGYRGVFTADLCDHLIFSALPRMKREEVLGADGKRRVHPHRTAYGALLGFGFADLPSVMAGRRLAELAGLPYSHGEPLSILRYRTGQEYRVHHDFLGPNDPDLVAHGQRQRTALLYLNDGYVGGETHFVVPDLRFAGKTGDVLVFHNVDENGATDFQARHAGRPIEEGEKWVASLWLRDRPFCG